MEEIKEVENNSEHKGELPVINEVDNTLWLSVSESAKLGGVTGKTIRRAIQDRKIRYSVNGNRYKIDFSSVINYLHSNLKLKNKLNNYGIGQYIKEWKGQEDTPET